MITPGKAHLTPAETKRRVTAGTTSPAPGLWVRPGFKRDGAIELVYTNARNAVPERYGLVQSIPDPDALIRAIRKAANYARRMIAAANGAKP